MIIDAHAHIYHDSVAERAISRIIENGGGKVTHYTDGTIRGLTASMQNAGIDYSVVLPVATAPGQAAGIIEWISSIPPETPGIIFFGSVHAFDSDYKSIIKKIKSLGLQGIKFHPGYQNFPADCTEALRVYHEALNSGLVLHFHSGFDPSLPDCDYTSIERFSNVLKALPGAKIILAHAGGMYEWQKVMDNLVNKGCYFDLAFVIEMMQGDETARQLYRQNEDYFIFGTDSPWCDQNKYVNLIRNSPTLSQEQKEKIFFRNLLKLIKIPSA